MGYRYGLQIYSSKSGFCAEAQAISSRYSDWLQDALLQFSRWQSANGIAVKGI